MKISKKTGLVLAFATIAVSGVALAQVRWTTFTSPEYGIRLSVPDVEHCHASEEDHVGHLACHYPVGINVDVYGSPVALTLEQLRVQAALRAPGVPANAWIWHTINDGQNGYRLAESWSAHGGGQTIIGLIGQSARRQMSHVVFISGADAVLQQNQASIQTFISNIQAQ